MVDRKVRGTDGDVIIIPRNQTPQKEEEKEEKVEEGKEEEEEEDWLERVISWMRGISIT